MSSDPSESRRQTVRNQREFDRSFVRSVVWTSVGKGVSQFLGWIATFVVARLLAPEDYGLVGMATVFLGLITLISESGIGITIVTLRDLGKEHIEQLNTLALLLGTAGFLACCAAAIPLGLFFQSDDLPLVVVALGITFPITGLKIVPRALLQLDHQFRLLGSLEIVNVVVLSACMIFLAMSGCRYWTLVLGAVISSAITTALTVFYRPQHFRWPQWYALRGALSFTKYQLGGSLLWYTYSHADQVVAGRMLGPGDLGAYSLAMSIANSIPEKITSVVTGVTPAFFAALHDKPAELKRYLLRLSEVLSLVTFPALVGLAVVADDFVIVVLGAKWEGVIMPLRLLAIYAAINATSQLITRVLTVRGDIQYLVRNGVILVVVLPIAFVGGSWWGPTGIAAAWVVVFPLTRIPLFLRLSANIDVSAGEFLKSFWPSISACSAMVVAVFLLKTILPSESPLALQLLLEVLGGATVYFLVVILFHRQRIEVLMKLRSAWQEDRETSMPL